MLRREVKDSAVPIFVTPHARARARERCPGFKAARIIDEVRYALKMGNFGTTKPEGFSGWHYRDNLYAWNDERAYALVAADNALVVTTTVARKHNTR